MGYGRGGPAARETRVTWVVKATKGTVLTVKVSGQRAGAAEAAVTLE